MSLSSCKVRLAIIVTIALGITRNCSFYQGNFTIDGAYEVTG